MDHAAHRAGGAEPHRRVLTAPPPPAPPGRAGGRIARNTAWNVAAIAVPLLAGLATIPVLAGELGPARFGLIGLAWAALEYFALLDAGLGRATVHFVARRIHAPDGDAGELVGASVAGQVALGVAAGAALALATPWPVGSLLSVPAALHGEARDAFLVLAATLPFVMLSVALRGVLEGAERFDAAAAVRLPSSLATFVVPAVAAVAGASVPQILVALLVVRVVVCAATWVLVRRCVPQLRPRVPRSWRPLRELAAFGGWIAASNVLNAFFAIFDRLVLGAIAGVAAVGFYTGPYEAAVRLLVLPAALVTAVFPRVSATAGRRALDGGGELAGLYLGTLRALAVPMLGVAAAGLVLAPELLAAWLGPRFADEATTAARLLLVGVVVNALAHAPSAFVQALGRPDLATRYHLVELVVHVPLTIVLVREWGIAGAAAAWAARALLDAALIGRAAHRMLGVSIASVFAGRWLRLAAVVGAVATLCVALQSLARHGAIGPSGGAAALAALAAAFAAASWRVVLPHGDRAALRAAVADRR